MTTVNKVIFNSLLFSADIGNIKYIYQLLDRLSTDQQAAVRKVLTELAPNGAIPLEQRLTLRTRISVVFQQVQPTTKFTAIRDLMPTIFSYLTKREIARAATVNSFFHEPAFPVFAEQIKTKRSWNFAELEKYRQVFHCDTIAEMLTIDPASTRLITELHFSGSDLHENDIIPIVKLCPGLTSINLGTLLKVIIWFGAGSVLPQISKALMSALVESCPLLTSVDLSNAALVIDEDIDILTKGLPKLSHLHLRNCFKLRDGALASIVRNCTDLKVANFSGCAHFSEETLISFFRRFPNLESLNLFFCNLHNNKTIAVINALGESCHSLRSLDLSGWQTLTDDSVETLSQSCADLTELSLSTCVNISDDSIRAIGQNCPKLASLDLQGCTNLTNACIPFLSENLTHLNLFNCHLITDDGIVMLSRRCKGLKSLNISQCMQLTDRSIQIVCLNCPALTDLYMDGLASLADGPLTALIKRPDLRFSGHHIVNKKVEQMRQPRYQPVSPLGQVYHQLLFQEKPAKDTKKRIHALLQKVQDKKLVDLVYAPYPKESEAWKKENFLDTLFSYVSNVLTKHLWQLSPEERNRVYGTIYRLAGSPKTDDPKWGEHHAAENLARLADAFSEVKKV